MKNLFTLVTVSIFSLWTMQINAQNPSPSPENILYVNQNVSGGSESGDSWANAIPELADALLWAHQNQNLNWIGFPLKIYVAKGTYHPLYSPEDGNNFGTNQDRDNTFLMVKSVQLYGGFDPANGILDLSHDRLLPDPESPGNGTILSGDIGGAGNKNNYSYHVVLSVGEIENALLDGFTISYGNADNLSGLTMTVNGESGINQANGGGMANINSSPKIMNVAVTDNWAAGYGGGIDNHNASPVLINVTIANNTADYGGGMSNYESSEPTLTNVTIADNSANVQGGGMINYESSPKIINTTISDNTSSNNGGGMHSIRSSPTITNSTIADNKSSGNGGGLSNAASSSALTNVAITNNTAFIGGGMFNTGSSPVITNSTIANNSATILGGGMYNASNSSPEIVNSIVWGNTQSSGSSIFNNAAANDNPKYSYSLIQGSGGSGSSWEDSFGVDGGENIDTDPLFIDPAIGHFHLLPGSPAIDAGNNGVYADANGSNKDLEGEDRIYNNTIDMGAYEFQGDPVICPAGNILYVNASATGNNTGENWADAFTDLQDALAQTDHCPGVTEIWVAEGTYQPASGQFFSMIEGIKIYGSFEGTESSLSDRVFGTEYTSLLLGNGNSVIRNDNNGLTAAAILDGFTIASGSSNEGGGIYNRNVSPILSHLSIGSNVSWNYGGGIYNENSSPEISDVSISNNNGSNLGGGMYNSNSSPTLTNVIISNNGSTHASVNGGGIYNMDHSSPILTNVTLSGNIASSNGGGVYNDDSSPVLTNVTLSGNMAFSDGGGIHNQSSSPVLTNVTISDNTAITGGGMYNSNSSPTLTNVIISNNGSTLASENGGGIYNVDHSSPILTNVTLSGNIASSNGGGVYNDDSSPVLTNVTISDNMAITGGGMYNISSSPKIYNTIIWGNTTSDDGTNIYNDGSINNPEFFNSLIGGSGGSGDDWNINFGTDGGGNIDADPLFTDPASGDYSLQACSPAINAGSNSHYADLDEDTKDLAGHPRVYDFTGGGIIDMGAYEFQGAPVNYEDVIFEDETVVYNGSTQTIEAENVPEEAEVEYTILDADSNEISGTVDAGEYTIIAAFTGCGPEEVLSAQLTITPAPLTITAHSGQFKEYGTAADPEFTFSASGFKGSDDETILTGSLTREGGEGMGFYAITQGSLEAGPNYKIEFISADFEIRQAIATQPPNCSNFSPAIGGAGTATVSAHDFVTNAGSAIYPIEVTVYDRWGIPLADWPQTFDAAWDTYDWEVCDLLGQTFEFSVSNSEGRCHLGKIDLNGVPAPVITSAWNSDDPRANVGNNKMVVYCGNVPAPKDHTPTVTMPCGGSYTGPVAMPDWVDVNACGDSDTAEVILRHWEAVGRDGQRNTMTDTIIVMRLPKLTAGAFVGSAKDSFYCDLHSYKEDGEDIYRYAAWKQPMGIADFEQPYSQMGALSYHIPGYVIEAGLINACGQSQSKYDSYLNYVIMKNPDGTVVTIKDIITGDYMFHPVTGVVNRVTTTQLGYGILNQIYEGATGLIDAITIGGWSSCSGGTYTFYNYLFPVIGSEVLSENGTYETVTEEWFYNGTGNSPYWFSGGWPSIYGTGDCTSYCSGAEVGDLDAGVWIQVPSLVADPVLNGGGETYSSTDCDTIRISSGTSCGLKIERERDDWADFQSCVRERGGRTTITQTCWASVENRCDDPEAPVGDTCLVVDYDDRTACCGRVIITLNQIQQLIDTIPPIFDFCYPAGWEGVEDSIRAGVQHGLARDFEENNPTIYTTNSHECGATIYVPDIQVSDNCSGVQSVRAVFHHLDGGVKKVALELTDTTLVPMGEGKVCTLYTYSHTRDPIHIPFTGCNGDPIEVVYNATDGCNESTWSKFVRVRDDVPPTAGTNHDVNVTMHSAVEYLGTASYDQGSWDNCAIELMLVRRSDWASNPSIVDLCSDAPDNLDNWVKILAEVGFAAGQVTTAAGGGVVSNVTIDIHKLDKYLNKGEIEQYYLQQIKKLWANGDCSEKVVHAWLFDLARALGESCASDDLSNTDLERIFDNLFDEAGYGNHLAFIGGGWAEMVPFTCEDACEEVPSDLLIVDYCCNVAIGSTETYVYDKSQASVSQTLPDLTIACEAYNLFFKDVVAEAAAYPGSDADSTGAFDALNEVFGGYVVTGTDNQGRPVDAEGTMLPDSVLSFEYGDITCREEGSGADKNVVLDTITETAANGIIATTCSGNYTQTVTVDMDECGLGTITRRFWVTSGCNGSAPREIASQRITIETACPMRESMFDVPSNLGSVKNPVCLPQEISNNNLLDTIGELTVKDHLIGKLCNQIAISHDVEIQKLVDYPDWIQYKITWKAIDWCCADALPEREYEFVQKVIARIDPECTLDEGGDENGDISLVQGSIETEKGDAVEDVEMKAVLGSGSPLTMVTSGDGAYNFSIRDGSDVSLLPGKNTGFANGVTTYDLVLIQRHVLQKELLDGKYKRIAADVNGDGVINAFDVFELRQLVMNPSGQLANNTSWRFFEKNTDREVFEMKDVKGDVNVDWIGVKIGDVDMDGDASRSSSRAVVKSGELTLNVADKQLKAGETYRMEVTSDNFADVMGMQYTLSYLPAQVEIESIEAGALNITENNYHRFAPGVITSSWSEADGQSLASDEVLFTIVLKAKSAVQLRDALSLNSRVTPVEAYAGGSVKDLSLRFDGGDTGFALYQNTPNPYQGETTIGFNLPEATKATLSVYDVTGKMLKVVEGEYSQGYNEVQLQSTDLNASGVLYYQLDTDQYTATKKMVVIKE